MCQFYEIVFLIIIIMNAKLPVLYSFRRCPYTMRARLALVYAGIRVELREIALRNKPEQLLVISPKGTVPVLHLRDGRVIDESLDIMQWALAQHDPKHWLAMTEDSRRLIAWNDGDFKYFLDRYKYADRYPDYPMQYYRQQAEVFLAELEGRLRACRYLSGKGFSLADAAIFPFIRQFAAVDDKWFQAGAYPALKIWLDDLSASALFNAVMLKYPVWTAAAETTILP